MKLLQKVDGQIVTLTQQVACVEREIAMRQRCYPRWISGGTMTQAKADEEIRNMKAVRQTLEEIEEEGRFAQ